MEELQLATLLKLTLARGCISRFVNCTNGTKSRNAPHITKLDLEFLMEEILC